MPNVQLNTIAPKKWIGDFGGTAPTLDISDEVRVGDIAIDFALNSSSSSSSGLSGASGVIWICDDNTEGAPVWRKLGRNASDLTEGNLAAGRLPTGGIWPLTSDLGISGGNVVFNYGYEDVDFIIRKLTSGDAYKYDAGTNTHTWYGASTYLQWSASANVFGVSNNSANQYTQIGNQGVGIVDGVNGLNGGFGVQRFAFSNSSVNLWAGLYWNEFIFNYLAQDIDFTIKKLTSGDALKYDAGLDTFTFGSGALFPEITLVNPVSEFSTDGTLSDNSDTAVPTEKAVKTYVDNSAGGIAGVSEKTDNYTVTTSDANNILLLTESTAANKTFTLYSLSGNTGNTHYFKNRSDYILTVKGYQVGTDAAESGSTTTTINATAHGFSVGQVIHITSGSASGEKRRILTVDTDSFTIGALSVAPSAGDTFEVVESIDGEYSVNLGYNESLTIFGDNDQWLRI